MKLSPRGVSLLIGCFLVGSVSQVSAAQINPLGKVIELLDSLAAKIAKEGEEELKAYKEFVEWCDDGARNLKFEIQTAKTKEGKLEAKIEKFASDIEVANAKTEELAQKIDVDTADLKAAGMIRKKEATDFAANEAELVDTVDTIERAIGILEKEMALNPAALPQIDTSSMAAMVQSISTVVDAASFSSNDGKKLLEFVQNSQGDDDEQPGAPAAAVYKSHSSNIVDVLEDLKEKAEAALADARKTEAQAKHESEMLQQHLTDLIAAQTKDLEQEKAASAAATEAKAAAEGELEVTTKARETSEAGLKATAQSCMTTAADHEATVAAREEELKAIKEARGILSGSTSGAVAQTYSLLQVSSSAASESRTLSGHSRVVALVKQLARKYHSVALAQLVSRMSTLVKYAGASGEDPFVKVKGLIQALIEKLEREAEAEATEKAYCDEEMAKTEAKKSELDDDITKLTTKIDQAAAKSAELKEDVKTLQEELLALAKTQAEMDKARADENAAYKVAKAELEEGLAGVRQALGVLRDYYGGAAEDTEEAAMLQQPSVPKHEKALGAGGSIIELLEVVESDFATNLAKEEQEESDAATEYEKTTQENKIIKATKDQDVKYKTQEFTALDKSISELSSDRQGLSTELAAVVEYYGQLQNRCVAKPETYEERKARREAEIQGLKEALAALEGEAAFLQRNRQHRNMRGARLSAA